MRFMNRYEIAAALERNRGDAILEPAARTLANLEEWADRNSDGWHIWPKPARAAARLMEILEGAAPATAENYRAALRPIRAFRTRHSADFVIVDERG